MTAVTEIPGGSRAWSIQDLERLPDDGRRYELLDGALLVSPAPVKRHQRMVGGLYVRLRAAAAVWGLTVYLAPTDWQPDRRTSLQPDLLVIADENPDGSIVTEIPSLVVEVLSPASRGRDLVEKRAKYESAGVSSYWVVDPEGPSVLALELVAGRYQVAGRAVGDQLVELRRPFPISFRPSALLDRSDG